MTNPALVMRYLDDRQKEKYPDALVFGIPFVAELISAFSKENYPFDYTPASIVSQNTLNKSLLNNFELAILSRHEEETGSFDVDPEQIQGYVDSVVLYIAACYTAVNQIPPMFMDETPDQLPQFTQLPIEMRARSKKFIMENAAWALRELQERDLVDGRSFMDKLVKKAASQMSNRSYQRGSRTARDTLLVYVDLIQAFLAGKFE